MLETSKRSADGHSNGNNGDGSPKMMSLLPGVVMLPGAILKRDGRLVPFEAERIENAVAKCFASLGYKPAVSAFDLTQQVVNIVSAKYTQPTVEQVQDIVETVLQAAGEYEAAKHYILYRAEHAKMREKRPIPEPVRSAFAESDQYFPTQLQKFQFYDKYSRFNYDLGRRETWIETVDRAVDYLRELSFARLPAETYERIRRAMLEMRAMTSMRLLAMAGPAARRNNITIYNCSYQPVDGIDSFVEAMIISMSGCGVGYSVESQYIENFPRVRRQTGRSAGVHVVEDSAEGWAAALRTGFETWFDGSDLKFDLTQLRPAGAPLRTKGGRASGPEPFRAMLDFVRARLLARQGSFIRPIDAHDMMCAVGNAAVSGGMRRTAMISLFDYDDEEMRHAKDGDFERENSQRWNANNSVVWPERGLTQTELARQMLEMVEGGRGEPGIFNRQSAIATKPERRKVADFGTNPCVTGDTWVAVADGRGRVRMRDLVAAGKDVDVYTSIGGALSIRKMRNPRQTGERAMIYRVSFADGTFIRVTPNHKFILTNGSEKQAIDLEPNDALTSATVYSYLKKGLPKVGKVSYDTTGGYRILQFGGYRKSEHRLIFRHHTGLDIVGIDQQIHHSDFDGLNNNIENLRLVSAAEHAQLHRQRMLGAGNPVHQIDDEWRANISQAVAGLANGNAKDVTNEELARHIAELCRQLGRVPTQLQYTEFAREHGLPQSFSMFRRAYFGGGVMHALQTIAATVGAMPAYEAEARRVTDLPITCHDGRTYVMRRCEICGSEFEVRLNRREQAVCSRTCSMTLLYRQSDTASRGQNIRIARTHGHDTVRARQMSIYNDLLVELGRHPTKKEWQARCRTQDVSPEISRMSSPFRYWSDLQRAALAANHRVVRVEPDGDEPVYTGTVDDAHTFFAIGCERKDQRGRTEMSYVLNRQCGEIVLRPFQFCNLSIAIARPHDTVETLREKVEIASIIGTIQSMATHFPGLRQQWRDNCEEERLLGVDINGQLDTPVAQDPRVQDQMLQVALEVNRATAATLGINASVAVTCVKPSGNSSQLFDCSPGIHTRWAPYYVRNVRVGTHTPIYKVLRDVGVPMDPENGQTPDNANTWVIHFPVKAPEGAVTRNDRSAIMQCEYWLQSKTRWTEHNPSVTITYHADEVLDIIKWTWEHREIIGGMTFLPAYDALYAQMPYVEINAEEYDRLAPAFPVIDFSKLFYYESEDLTTAAQELACLAGSCEVDYGVGQQQ